MLIYHVHARAGCKVGGSLTRERKSVQICTNVRLTAHEPREIGEDPLQAGMTHMLRVALLSSIAHS